MKQRLELLVVQNDGQGGPLTVYLDHHRIAGQPAYGRRGPVLAQVNVDRSDIEIALSRVDLDAPDVV